MKEEHVTFPSADLTLEGMLAKPATPSPERGLVVCHPHPLYGGAMYNNVVEASLEASWRLNWVTLRFNFRGVGRSEGEHSGGAGEAEDAAAAVRYLAGELGLSSQKITLAGYSFGAMAAMNAAPTLPDLAALVLIALPLRMAAADILTKLSAPIILSAGDQDNYCPSAQLQALHQTLGNRGQLQIIEGADHFFGGYEEELAAALEGMLRKI
jgi:alpha/beta superfamily hydrolase